MKRLNVHFIVDSNDADEEICRKYWELSEAGTWQYTVAELSRSYHIPSHKLSQMVKSISYVTSHIENCINCSVPRVAKTRSEMPITSLKNNNNSFVCASCKEEARIEKEREKIEKQVSMNERIETFLSDLKKEKLKHCETVNEDLPYNIIILLALIKHSGSETLEYIEPISGNIIDHLSPSKAMTREIWESLENCDMIYISQHSDKKAFVITDEDDINYYPLKVAWEVGVVTPTMEHVNLPTLYRWLNDKVSSEEFIEKSWGCISNLARSIVLEEALSYLNLELERRGFPSREGEKTLITLSEALAHFSLSQVCWIISNRLRYASDMYRQGQAHGLKHASNQVISGISGYVERAIANKWDVTRYRRDNDLPQSVLSRVVFNLILKTDDGGFNYNLDELLSKFDWFDDSNDLIEVPF